MDSSSSSSDGDESLEEQLVGAADKLADNPPISSVAALLPLLDEAEKYLAQVDQSPSESMQTALAPIQNALIADQLFRHPDVDVRVAVAACISEITRITAPEPPYDDGRMVDVFELIVASFENLEDMNSRSYSKRVSILETVAKVRSCVVMLDLQCDKLIADMFCKFFNSVRDYHPENVVSSMETIMMLVIQESEDELPTELITPLLASVKEENQGVLPVARKMGGRVLEACGPKVIQYMVDKMKVSSSPLEDDDGFISVPRDVCMEEEDMKASCSTSGSWLGSRYRSWLFR